MSRIRAVSKILFVLGVVATTVVAGNATVHAAAWAPPVDFANGQYGINIVDSFITTGEGTSRIQVLSKDQIGGMPNEYLCNDSRTGVCDFTPNGAQAFTIMPLCKVASDTDCIYGLSLSGTDGTFQRATYVRTVSGTTFAANAAENLPVGSNPSLWSSAIGNTGGAGKYEVFVQVVSDWNNGKFVPHRLTAAVIPYSEITGGFKSHPDTNTKLSNGRTAINFGGPDANCVWADSGTCGVQEDYTPGTQVKLSIRLDSALGGWFRGRLNNPDIQVAKAGSSSNLVTVTGQPATVPQIVVAAAKSTASDAIKNFFVPMNGWAGGGVNLRADYANAFDGINAFRSAAGDKVQGQLTQWSFGSFSSFGNPCLSDTSKVQGLVTTNATVYDGQAPAFNNGQLTYKVGSYHYLPDGTTLNLGTYDLIMRKDTARCLYKFSSAPISASVSVTTDNGTENVADASFSEQGDWDHFYAHGFTFSNPSISVKMTQAGSTSGSAAAYPLTITCAKGKLVKKVTGTAPKCPAGWKKK